MLNQLVAPSYQPVHEPIVPPRVCGGNGKRTPPAPTRWWLLCCVLCCRCLPKKHDENSNELASPRQRSRFEADPVKKSLVDVVESAWTSWYTRGIDSFTNTTTSLSIEEKVNAESIEPALEWIYWLNVVTSACFRKQCVLFIGSPKLKKK